MAYSKEIKRKAVKMANDIGIVQTSQELGIHYTTVRDWVRADERKNDEYTKHIRRLEVENNKLRKANDILIDLVTSQQIRLDKLKASNTTSVSVG